MGIYLNPGFDNLMTDRRGDNYIDKSMLIKELNGFIRKTRSPNLCIPSAPLRKDDGGQHDMCLLHKRV